MKKYLKLCLLLPALVLLSNCKKEDYQYKTSATASFDEHFINGNGDTVVSELDSTYSAVVNAISSSENGINFKGLEILIGTDVPDPFIGGIADLKAMPLASGTEKILFDLNSPYIMDYCLKNDDTCSYVDQPVEIQDFIYDASKSGKAISFTGDDDLDKITMVVHEQGDSYSEEFDDEIYHYQDFLIKITLNSFNGFDGYYSKIISLQCTVLLDAQAVTL